MSIQVTVKLSERDYQTFVKFAELTHSDVSTVLSEIIESAGPGLSEAVPLFTGLAKSYKGRQTDS